MAANNTKQILINNSSTDCSNDLSMAAQTKNCDIRLVSQFVSRRHATLVRLPRDDNSNRYYYRIVDGDAKGKPSSNGIMVNGRKMLAHDLKNEDEIVFGPQVRAIYYLLRDTMRVGQTDSSEYDITLINPGMTEDLED